MSVLKFSEAKSYVVATIALLNAIWLLSSCGMGKREKFIEYNNCIINCFSDTTYYKKMRTEVKVADELEKYLNYTKDSIARSYDYPSYLDAEKIFNEYPDDVSIRKLKFRRDSIVETKMNQHVLYFQFDLLKKSNPLHD